MNAEIREVFDPIKWLEYQFSQHFHCVVGPARAYFELNEPAINPRHTFRCVYQTFAVVTPADCPEDRMALATYMWDNIFKPVVDKLVKHDPERTPADNLLFWRIKPTFEAGPNNSVGLRMRLAVPGVRVPGEKSHD